MSIKSQLVSFVGEERFLKNKSYIRKRLAAAAGAAATFAAALGFGFASALSNLLGSSFVALAEYLSKYCEFVKWCDHERKKFMDNYSLGGKVTAPVIGSSRSL